MKLTANTIIKLFIDAIGQAAMKDFYEHNWEARKKEIQKLLKEKPDPKKLCFGGARPLYYTLISNFLPVGWYW